MKEQISCPLAASTPAGELENKQSTGREKKSNIRERYVALGGNKIWRRGLGRAQSGRQTFKEGIPEDLTAEVTLEQRW